jgi:hypothetical protein
VGQKYTVQFDCGQVVYCFSNTLHLEKSTASLPPVEIQAAISEVEAEGTHTKYAAQIIKENKAAANDIEEEHLPADSPEAIAAAEVHCRGCKLWAKENNELPPSANPKTWQSIIKSLDFGKYLGDSRFKEYRKIKSSNLGE